MTKEELLLKLTDIEWDDFEVKAAYDKLPENVWETVSAFSNTSGGWIVFGVAQKGKRFEVQGVNNGEKTESDFLNTLRNGQKFNHKLHPNVVFNTDLLLSDVTFYRQLGKINGGSATPVTTPVTTPVVDIEEKIIQIIISSPTISKAEIASVCGMSVEGIRYHITKMRKKGLIEWVGNSRNGKWIINKVE